MTAKFFKHCMRGVHIIRQDSIKAIKRQRIMKEKWSIKYFNYDIWTALLHCCKYEK